MWWGRFDCKFWRVLNLVFVFIKKNLLKKIILYRIKYFFLVFLVYVKKIVMVVKIDVWFKMLFFMWEVCWNLFGFFGFFELIFF